MWFFIHQYRFDFLIMVVGIKKINACSFDAVCLNYLHTVGKKINIIDDYPIFTISNYISSKNNAFDKRYLIKNHDCHLTYQSITDSNPWTRKFHVPPRPKSINQIPSTHTNHRYQEKKSTQSSASIRSAVLIAAAHGVDPTICSDNFISQREHDFQNVNPDLIHFAGLAQCPYISHQPDSVEIYSLQH